MLDERVGWRFSPLQESVERPASAVVQAIALLIRYEDSTKSHHQITTHDRWVLMRAVQGFGTMISEALGSHLASPWAGSSSNEQASKLESAAMTHPDQTKLRDDDVEGQLSRIVSNPSTAREAFPEPEIRENIVSLVRHFRNLADRSSKKKAD
jgi:hypothetical protein